MEQEIHIKSAEQKTAKSGQLFVAVTTATGSRYSCWNPMIYTQLTEGVGKKLKCVVEEQNGFMNILGINADLGVFELPAAPASQFGGFKKSFGGMGSSMEKASEAKKDSMILSNCLNNATTFGLSKGLDWTTIVDNAIIAFQKFNTVTK